MSINGLTCARAVLITFSLYLLSGCVSYNETLESVEPNAQQDIASEENRATLLMLKKQMKACATQYAIASESTGINIEYAAQDQHITYRTNDRNLFNFMQQCAGTYYVGNGKDNGSIKISGTY